MFSSTPLDNQLFSSGAFSSNSVLFPSWCADLFEAAASLWLLPNRSGYKAEAETHSEWELLLFKFQRLQPRSPSRGSSAHVTQDNCGKSGETHHRSVSTQFIPAVHMYLYAYKNLQRKKKKTTCSFFLSRCESVNEHFEILWLRENHLNQFCLSTSVTLIPSSGSWQFWQLVLQRDGIHANKHLIIGSNNVLFSSHRRLIRVGVGWILTFRAVCRGRVGAATAIRIDYRLLPLS